jgi:G3E family GTPase
VERYQHPYIRRLFRTGSSVRHLARARAGVPLTIVTGEPGSGKSTLLANLQASNPECLAVLRHDRDASSRLTELVHSAHHAFLEVASPAELPRAAGYAYMPGFRPCGVVFVMSAPSLLAMRADVLPQRLAEASVIIINKADMLTGIELQRAAGWLSRNIAPMPVLWAHHGRVATPLFLGVDRPGRDDNVPLVVAPWSRTLELDGKARRKRTADVASAERCRAWSLQAAIPVEPTEFRTWVERLPHTVIRGHGNVTLEIERPIQHRFELFGAHWGLERIGQLDGALAQSRIFLVGVA